MVTIKLLDTGPYYYHEFNKRLKVSYVREYDEATGKTYTHPETDGDGYVVREEPQRDWLLPFEPAYILTDEDWLKERILKYAEEAFDQVDIVSEDPLLMSAVIPQERLDLCIPPSDRRTINMLPVIPKTKSDRVAIASDGIILGD